MERTSSVYDPLDPDRRQIRLISLHRAAGPTKFVSVKLEPVDFTPETEYIALSYVWGDRSATTDILVNDVPFAVSLNLASALAEFHLHNLLCGVPDGRPLRVWVDAICINQHDLDERARQVAFMGDICINQHDLDERARQVAFMGDIYGNATHIFSWLGHPDADDYRIDLALDLIRDITTRMKSGRISGSVDYDSYHDGIHMRAQALDTSLAALTLDCRQDLCRANHDGYIPNELWDSIRNFMRSSYWDRVWVQQEIALAKPTEHCHIFMCGRSHVSMRDLDIFIKIASHVSQAGRRPLNMAESVWVALRTGLFFWCPARLNTVRRLRRARLGERRSYFNLLHIATSCMATDPRDKVYALNGVLDLGIRPDYRKPVREVYLEWFHQEFTKVFAIPSEMNSFITMILECASTTVGINTGSGLPSWLPDLSQVVVFRFWDRSSSVLGGHTIAPEQMALLRGQHAAISLRFEPILEKAILYASFQGVDPRTDAALRPEDWPLFWIVMEYCATRELNWEEINKILLGYNSTSVRSAFPDHTQDTGSSQDSISAPLLLEQMSRCLNTGYDSQFFETSNGYIGRGEMVVRSTDHVCILNGVRFPVILRKEEEHWTFVGGCYVYGVSPKDAAEVMQRDGLELQWFSIR
ncbi:hypothetical protein LQW54_001380 [Pestalotiopsis sp. IQ-011]